MQKVEKVKSRKKMSREIQKKIEGQKINIEEEREQFKK